METNRADILAFEPSVPSLQRRVRKLASIGEVVVATALLPELATRQVSDIQLVRSLRRGVIVGDVKSSQGDGGWLCLVLDKKRQHREIRNVFLEIGLGRLWVLKIDWELS